MEHPMQTSTEERIAQILCEAIDWERPELAALAETYRAGDALGAALGVIRHLRERETPRMGYTAEYIAALRANATPAFRAAAEEEIDRLLRVPFMGGDWPDGRGTLLHVRPEVMQVACKADDFNLFARCVMQGVDTWEKAAIHSIMGSLRFCQAVWPLAECSDAAVLPVLAFLVYRQNLEWQWSRGWGEVTFGTNGHNWFAAQYGTTWKVAFLFPELRGSNRFQALFPTYFERELSLLLFPDGFTHEASVNYHSGTIDLFYDCLSLAEYNGLPVPDALRRRVYDGYAVEWKLFCPDGGMPPFGDCWARGPYFLDRQRSIAALMQMPEAKWVAEQWAPDWQSPFGPMMIEALHYTDVGQDLAPAYHALEAQAPTTLDTILPASGYYVMRESWTPAADYAAIEATPKGNVITSHGHGAIFDLLLYAKGRQITVGNGKGPDGVIDPERSWRHQTMSHTVATVDSEHHLPLKAVYRFNNVVLPTVDTWISQPGYAYFSGAHEAYERLPKKVSCRRKLFYLRGQYWVLIDRFTAERPEDAHTYQQIFQLGVPSRLDGDRVLTEGAGGNLLFLPVEGVRGAAAIAPCPYPLGGDYADPDQLTFTHDATGSFLFVSVLVPFRDAAVPDVQARLLDVETGDGVVSPWEVTGLEITLNGRRDLYVDTHMHWNMPWRCGGFAGEGRLFHSEV
jgi:hypothetical protein